ncbi:hypothetical protein BROUX41_006660 [Berkeleyomyces rouxiae]
MIAHSHPHAHTHTHNHTQPHAAAVPSPPSSRKLSPVCRGRPSIASQGTSNTSSDRSVPIARSSAKPLRAASGPQSTPDPSNDTHIIHTTRDTHATHATLSPGSSSVSIASTGSVSVLASNVGSATTQATDPATSDRSSLRSPSPTVPHSVSTRDLSDRRGDGALVRPSSSHKTACAKNDGTEPYMDSAFVADGIAAHHTDSQYESETETETESQQALGCCTNQASPSATVPRSTLVPQPKSHVVKIRDLSHVRGLVRAELLTGTPLEDTEHVRYDISGMPVEDVIEMAAALLTKITSTNDLHHDPTQRSTSYTDPSATLSSTSTSVLAFHGKNIPAITILSYLSRVHRYCPTTYEVFLSLLVYFDRMTERVNSKVVKSEKGKQLAERLAKPDISNHPTSHPASTESSHGYRADSYSSSSDSDIADDGENTVDTAKSSDDTTSARIKPSMTTFSAVANGPSTYFVVDSYNIHRLIIAGVTCASKFFSDVFYTNSRYAKVGGLPLAELNHLEVQFLLLNDFRLFIPAEDLEAYATMLVEFYAREVVLQRANIDGE